ncbi:MAG: hypothetical protein ABIV26_06020 [Candidatus Limnocylindrales bacterium]
MANHRRPTTAALVPVLALGLVAACAGGARPSSGSTEGPTPTPKSQVSASSTATPPTPSDSPSRFPILPGEQWLAFAWYPDVLYLVHPDGSGRHPLDIGVAGIPFSPAWSPDGKRLAFVLRGDTSPTPNGSIWTANADGSDAAMLYEDKNGCSDGSFWPSWSPDGTRLSMVCYYQTADGGFGDISILDPVTKVRTAVATLKYPDTVDNPVSWSPDGKTLAFEIITWDPTDQFLSQSVVATVPAAGGPITKLTDPTLFGAHPDWSPDGSLIAFNTYDTGNMHGIEQPSNVYSVAPNGTGLRQVSTASIDGKMRLGQPFWSADGTRIWVSIAREFERDSNDQFKNTLGWVDATSGDFHEIGTEGKRFRERPIP